MDIKSFLIGLLCSVLIAILFVAWSDMSAAPAVETETFTSLSRWFGRRRLPNFTSSTREHATSISWSLLVALKKCGKKLSLNDNCHSLRAPWDSKTKGGDIQQTEETMQIKKLASLKAGGLFLLGRCWIILSVFDTIHMLRDCSN